jgi:hypothetical protein
MYALAWFYAPDQNFRSSTDRAPCRLRRWHLSRRSSCCSPVSSTCTSTPAINEGCTRSLRTTHISRRAPLQPVPKTQEVPCTPYHPPYRTGVTRLHLLGHNLNSLTRIHVCSRQTAPHTIRSGQIHCGPRIMYTGIHNGLPCYDQGQGRYFGLFGSSSRMFAR